MKIDEYIRSLCDNTQHFYFDAVLNLPRTDMDIRGAQVADTIYRMLGLWALMASYFFPSSGTKRHVEQAWGSQNTQSSGSDANGGNGGTERSGEAGKRSLCDLVKKSGLLPHSEEDGLKPSPSSTETKTVFHLRPEETSRKMGFSSLLAYEIRDSYAALFSPEQPSFLHQYPLGWVGSRFWCWSLPCSAQRLLRREVKALKADPILDQR
ncbi:hypothetical protein K469DRAFT_682813 [Zopfia rhizophila CBS 207.26]|uniref:Uncharacterized protein n=1 Tax=Zopfia rhizophila CBS 207.26 TaxID=1314779 RepID=A0A6A6DC36_9PEZI|nr:hypothetical protein K469DRAFT_682813 [Zopfia rhizophila CBS 207.26]